MDVYSCRTLNHYKFRKKKSKNKFSLHNKKNFQGSNTFWYELMISTQWLRLHCGGRTCAFKDFCSIVLACLDKGSLHTYSHISVNASSFLWGTVSCAVPILGTMACLWVVLEAHKAPWSLQELKLKIVPAIQSMGATSQAFRGNQNHLKMMTFGEIMSCGVWHEFIDVWPGIPAIWRDR